LPEIRDYFLDDFCVCPVVRQTMTLRRFEKNTGQYLHLSDDEDIPSLGDENYDYLYKARPALDTVSKFGQFYKPGRGVAVDEEMAGCFWRENHMPMEQPVLEGKIGQRSLVSLNK
jgi:hypothetical protein